MPIPLYPPRKPKVSDVKHWEVVYEAEPRTSWRGIEAPQVRLSRSSVNYHDPNWRAATYFPGFYKLEVKGRGTKYFYGETAHHDVARVLGDLGHDDAYYKLT